MKVLTKEQEAAHYRATLTGGTIGTLSGLGLGLAGVYLGSQRYHFIRSLTLPLKAFLVTSSATFVGIVSADHYSHAYEQSQNIKDVAYRERQEARAQAETAGKSFTERAMEFGRRERYKIVVGSWVASMFAAFALVNRNKYLTGQQKIVQARVYAQFLTLGVLVASAAFEISDSRNQEGRWETVKYIDPNDPEHKRVLEKKVRAETGQGAGSEKEDRSGNDLWKDMVESEERRMKEKDEEEKKFRKEAEGRHAKKGGNGNKKKEQVKKEDGGDDAKEGGDEKKDDKREEKKDDKKK